MQKKYIIVLLLFIQSIIAVCSNFPQSPDSYLDIAISGNYAFCAVGRKGLDIYNIKNSDAPIYIKNIKPTSDISKIKISGKYCYILNSIDNHFCIIDISDINNIPIMYNTQLSSSKVYDFLVKDNLLIYSYNLSGDNASIKIIKFKEDLTPETISIAETISNYSEDMKSIVFYRNYIYGFSSNSLFIFSISNINNPEFIDQINGIGYSISSAIIVKDKIIVSNGDEGFIVYDLHTPSNPVLANKYSAYLDSKLSYYKGKLLSFGTKNLIQIYNLNENKYIEHKSNIKLKSAPIDCAFTNSGIWCISESKKLEYIPDNKIFDISPFWTSKNKLKTNGVTISNDIAYLSCKDGFYTFDIHFPEHPELLGYVNTINPLGKSAIKSNYAYVINYPFDNSSLKTFTKKYSRVDIIDISNPTLLKKTSYYDLNSYDQCTGLQVTEDYLFVLYEKDGLHIIDNSIPENLQFINKIKSYNEESIKNFTCNKDYVFLQTSSKIEIFSIVDPVIPVKLSEIVDEENRISAIYIHNNFLYAYKQLNGSIEVYDINSIESPKFIESINHFGRNFKHTSTPNVNEKFSYYNIWFEGFKNNLYLSSAYHDDIYKYTLDENGHISYKYDFYPQYLSYLESKAGVWHGIADNLLVLSDMNNGIKIYRTNARDKQIGKFELNNIKKVKWINDLAVCQNEYGFSIYDFSNMNNGNLLSDYKTKEKTIDMAIINNSIVLTTKEKAYFVSINDPSKPKETLIFKDENVYNFKCGRLGIYNNYLMMENNAYSSPKFAYFFDISNNTQPTLISYNQFVGYEVFHYVDHYMYQFTNGGLYIVDINSLHSPKQVNYIELPFNYPRFVSVEGNNLIYSTYTGGIYIFDISNPEFPAIENHMDNLNYYNDSEKSYCKNNVLISCYNSFSGPLDKFDLSIYDISNTNNITLIDNINSVRNFKFFQDKLYVRNYNDNTINIYDCTSPNNFSFIKSYSNLPAGELSFHNNLIIVKGDENTSIYPFFSIEKSSALIPHIDWSQYWQTFIQVDSASKNLQKINFLLYKNGKVSNYKEVQVEAEMSKLIPLDKGVCGQLFYNKNNLLIKEIFISKEEGGTAEFTLNENIDSKIKFVLPKYNSDNLTWEGLGIMNSSTNNAEVKLSAYNSSGEKVNSCFFNLKPFDKSVGLINEYFPKSDFNNIAYVLGESSSTLCGINISGKNNDSLLFTKALGSIAEINKLYITHIASSWDQWSNLIIIDNTGTSNNKVLIKLFSKEKLILNKSIELIGGESKIINLNTFSSLEPECGYIENFSHETIIRQSFINKSQGGTAEFLLTNLSSKKLLFSFPIEDVSNDFTWNGLALLNTQQHTSTITIYAYSNGEIVNQKVIQLKPNTKYVDLIDNIFNHNEHNIIEKIIVESTEETCGIIISGKEHKQLLFMPAINLQ